jgi:transposase-like protein
MDDRMLDALLDRSRDEAGGLRLTGEGSMLGELVKAVLERALEGELTAHLGYERGDRAGRGGGPPNYRNGSIAKTVQTGVGPVPLAVPRDRAGTFEPLLIPKRSGRVAGGLDDMVISLYAHGMSVRDILHHLEQVYGTQLSAETVSRITDQVLEEVRAWQARPLEQVYAVVFPAAIWAGSATTRSCRTSPPTSRSGSTPTGRSTCWASGWPRPPRTPRPRARVVGLGHDRPAQPRGSATS